MTEFDKWSCRFVVGSSSVVNLAAELEWIKTVNTMVSLSLAVEGTQSTVSLDLVFPLELSNLDLVGYKPLNTITFGKYCRSSLFIF